MAFLSPAHSGTTASWAARRLRFWSGIALSLLASLLCWSGSGAPAHHVKAAFLFNFAQFTEWPQEAFNEKDSPLVIGILGTNPFGDFLAETVRDELAHGRRITIEHYSKLAEIKTCHILYIAQSEASRLDRVRDTVKDKPVLTVTDVEGAAARGIVVEFMTAQNRIRFRINQEAAKAGKLNLSSKLLRVAYQGS